MKRLTTIIMLLVTLHITGWAMEHGVPFFKNFTAIEYKAHNHNFDIACDNYGTVYVANFEGLVYYDGATWRKIFTPGISRVTCIEKGPKGKMWIGGYNIFGYLTSNNRGCLQMKLLMSDVDVKNDTEVKDIKVSGQDIYMITTKGKVYHVKDDKRLEVVKYGSSNIFNQAKDSTRSFRLPDMVRVSYNQGWGLRFTMPDNSIVHLSETDGLPTNAIDVVTYDEKHTLWGATEKGLFCAEVVTPYSRLTDNEGLKGEVYCINELGKTIYIGTLNGLFILKNGHVTNDPTINLACWDLVDDGHNQLIAPCSEGLFIISASGTRKITNSNSYSAYIDEKTGDYIVGETDGVYRISPAGKRVKIATPDKVITITKKDNNLLLTNIYGAQWQMPANATTLVTTKKLRSEADASYSKICFTDFMGRVWKTNGNGTNLKIENDKTAQNTSYWIHPLKDKVLNCLHVCHDGNIVAGGDFGVIFIDAAAMKGIKVSDVAERPYIREVIVMGDSVVWGGYSQNTLKPVFYLDNIELPSACHEVTVTFSTQTSSLVIPTQYRYRLNGGQWSAWTTDTYVEFKNLIWGRTTLEIQSRDIYGRLSELSTVKWSIDAPWYVSWWALLFYLIITIYIIALFFRWRERKLERDKQKLEGIVAERTSELSAAYDNQQKISSELSDTLDDLKRTQSDLVRMERTATAGKLTQGLIDRILNPINYINNFSKLTSGLAKDLKEDIEDEKDNMTEDNYEDCEDILDMMNQNLSKIEEHGVNTTRTLRAMEAMLNNHVGTLVNQDICPLCRQVVEVTEEHFKEDITNCGITIKLDTPNLPVMVNIDAESMNKVLLSLISNSIYAITKKYSQMPYSNAKIVMSVKHSDDKVVITIHDNGIGIEETIKDKVFDPFFTTKPTGEATGVGLYLVHEIINDHHGTVTLNSAKGDFCEFTITL